MTNFVSPAGFETLCDIRVDSPPPVTPDKTSPVQLLACVPSEECGCPEELWRIDGWEVLIHFEEDGSSEMFIYGGDFELERSVQACDMMELRSQMFAWIGKLYREADHEPT